MMTVDNLPTQLPRDASEYFGAALTPVLKGYLQEGLADPVIDRAAIALDGRIVARLAPLLQPKLDAIASRRFLVLGAGYVAGPVADYLLGHPTHSLTIAAPSFDALPAELLRRLQSSKRVRLLQEEIGDAGQLGRIEAAIGEADVVISLLPATMHPLVLESVFRQGKHLVTASYTSPAMEAFREALADKGLVWVNEAGLDPGLDHMSAMRLIDAVRNTHHIDSFISWCGGLPAPENADNPLGYKFSWSPRGVLLATQAPSQHLQDGRVVRIDGGELLGSARALRLHPAFAFEGLPNRDALKYIPLYGLSGVQTMFRGTLRYAGFSEIMHGLTALGLLQTTPAPAHANWREALQYALGIEHCRQLAAGRIDWPAALAARFPDWPADRRQRLLHALNVLGMLDDAEPFDPAPTRLDSLCALLRRKLFFSRNERDMAFMHHELIVRNKSGPPDAPRELLTSTLCEFGRPAGETAMARTVGLPVAIVARLIADGAFRRPGLHIPTGPDLYVPVLAELETLGIRFVEGRMGLSSGLAQ